jgi:hypothetical protein
MKADEQWCHDNGVPEEARYSELHNSPDAIKLVNGLLRDHGLVIRTKHRRGHGTGSYVWVERADRQAINPPS